MKQWFLTLILATSAFAEEEEMDIAKVSEAMGHLIGKNLQLLGLDVDYAALAKGIEEASLGKTSPLTEDECIQALSRLQEEGQAAFAQKNLQEADAFLAKNATEEGVVPLEKGKLHYRIDKKGSGDEVSPYATPVVRYEGRFLNGELFRSENELLPLEESLPGFAKGIAGMKEGEIRTLYIHPDLGYGREGTTHPNSLLIFQVEVLKADASAEAHAASQKEEETPILR